MIFTKNLQAFLWFLLTLIVLVFFVPLVKAAPPQYFQSTPIITSGLNGPSAFDIAPDGRIFILQRTGEVKIYKNGALLPQNFVSLPSASTGDRGLIGIAFDPDFATNKYVYFYYTAADDLRNYLVRFSAETDIAQNGPVIIYNTPGPSFQLHVGGGLIFGNDGKIYLGIGDNGYGPNAQDKLSPHGKILRLNKDGSIPSDNPFVNSPEYLPEIYSLGLRNPWRLQIDSNSGRIFVSDVGANEWEEINLVTAGKNFGWPICEGVCDQLGTTDPFYTYNHLGQSSAVTMGPIYSGNMFPESYQNKVFFADYARGFIRYLSLDESGNFLSSHDFDMTAGTVVDLKQVYDGSLYYITYYPGRLYRISYSETSQIPVAVSSANILKGLPPLVVEFSSAGTFDPDSDQLSFFWDFGDGNTSNQPNPIHTYVVPGAYTVELTVSDGSNQALSIPLVVQVGVSPILTIGMPQPGLTYKAGDTINYSAHAVDGVGNDINDLAISTEVIFHHDTHIHPFMGPVIGRSGSFQIPVHGEPDTDQWYEIIVTVTDQSGLSTTKSVGVYPQTVSVEINTIPTGLTFYLDGKPHQSPANIPYVVNYQEEINAPQVQSQNGKEYIFYGWSNGQERTHTLIAPQNQSTLTAYYFSPQDSASFTGEFFSNQNLSGPAVYSQISPEINFDWGFSSPDSSLPVDSFSARWTSTQNFPPGLFRFIATGDDGVRLYVDGNLLIDKWTEQGPIPHTADIYLSSGEHQVVFEYFESGGQAISKLSWSPSPIQPTPSPTTSPVISPTPTPTVAAQSHFTGVYFANKNLSGPPVYTSYDPIVNFDWGDEAPNPLTPKDEFSVRWSKLHNFDQSGLYRFTSTSDDGIRLYVNNVLYLDKWQDQSVASYSVDVPIIAGVAPIVLEYYDGCCSAVAKLNWTYQSPIPSSTISPTPTTVPTTTPAPTPVVTTTPMPTPPISSNGTFVANYYSNKHLSGLPVYSDTTTEINYFWGDNAPNLAVPKDDFSIHWSGNINISPGVYRFYSRSDDGVRLSIDGNLIIDKWIEQSVSTYTADIVITNNSSQIEYEFFDGCCTAVARLWWEKISDISSTISPTPALPTPTVTPALTPLPTPTPIPGLPKEGFEASYYAGINLSGNPIYNTIDDEVSFNWGDDSPHPSVPKDGFSARWQNPKLFTQSGIYSFKVTADDGVRLWIDGELLIDKWIDQSKSSYEAQKYLDAGVHQVMLEYYDNCCSATISFSWDLINFSTPTPTPVPTIIISPIPPLPVSPPIPTPTPTPSVNYFVESFFDNTNLLGSPIITKTSSEINYDWGFGAPDAALPPDGFSGRWEGQYYLSGWTTFTVTTDDGVRFYIDNELLIDNWSDQPPTTFIYNRTFEPGVYTLKMEYFESGGIAIARLNW